MFPDVFPIRKLRLIRFFVTDYLRVLVLDEADSMLEITQGGSGGNAALAMQIKKRCPRNCQILLFSATYPQSVWGFCMAFAPNAKKFSIAEARSLNLAYIKQVRPIPILVSLCLCIFVS